MNERVLVTDTHPLLYFFCDGGRRLSKKAKQAFTEATRNYPTVIFVPTPVLWEMSMLVQDGDIKLSKPFGEWIDDLFTYQMINIWPFDHDTVKILHNVRYHSDPFDCAIVASALQLDRPLITNDGAMHDAKPCQLLWD